MEPPAKLLSSLIPPQRQSASVLLVSVSYKYASKNNNGALAGEAFASQSGGLQGVY